MEFKGILFNMSLPLVSTPGIDQQLIDRFNLIHRGYDEELVMKYDNPDVGPKKRIITNYTIDQETITSNVAGIQELFDIINNSDVNYYTNTPWNKIDWNIIKTHVPNAFFFAKLPSVQEWLSQYEKHINEHHGLSINANAEWKNRLLAKYFIYRRKFINDSKLHDYMTYCPDREKDQLFEKIEVMIS